jgi:O-methyltransferase involved in polyketide biosynthesis
MATVTKGHVVFLLEGVLIYLNNGVPRSLLSSCSSVLKRAGLSGSLVFADLLRDIASLDVEGAEQVVRSYGWGLVHSSCSASNLVWPDMWEWLELKESILQSESIGIVR